VAKNRDSDLISNGFVRHVRQECGKLIVRSMLSHYSTFRTSSFKYHILPVLEFYEICQNPSFVPCFRLQLFFISLVSREKSRTVSAELRYYEGMFQILYEFVYGCCFIPHFVHASVANGVTRRICC
jgi:hypothetical protein